MSSEDEKKWISSSSSRYFEQGAKQGPTREQIQKKKQQEQKKDKLKLDVLKNQVSDKTKPDDTMKTMSTTDEAKADTLDAHTKTNAERTINQEKRSEAGKKEQKDQMQEMG